MPDRFISFLLLIVVFVISKGFSQNLVPNPSFENISNCPSGNSEIYQAVPWDRPPGSITSPDLFNACNTAGVGCSDVNVPDNFTGSAGWRIPTCTSKKILSG